MNIGRKIVALNLGLVFLIGLGFPGTAAFAAEEEQVNTRNLYAPSQGVCVDDINQSDALGTNALNMDASLTATDVYRISVDGKSFQNNTDSSGSGWSYTSSTGVLQLSDYSGSSITASGDLTVYTNGNVKVTGYSGTYGSAAISVSGMLSLGVFSGTATLCGGTGSTSGGNGITASTLYVFSDSTSNFICSGGYGTTHGGYGIAGKTIHLGSSGTTIAGGGSAGTAGDGICFSSYLYRKCP